MSKNDTLVSFHQALAQLIRESFSMVVVGVVCPLCTKVKLPPGAPRLVNRAIAEAVEYNGKHMSMDRINFEADLNPEGEVFHDALPKIIMAARNQRELRFLFDLMSRSVIPGNQDAIVSAWRLRVQQMQIRSPGDIEQLFVHRRQMQDAA